MLSFVRRRFTIANVALTLALVFAMSGGAYAAGKYLITSTKQISPKVLKSLTGKNGVAGATGAAGPQGSQGAQGPSGPQGSAGTEGAKGEPGAEGKAGTNGKGVTSKALAKGEGGCAEGGSEFTSATGKTTACNGAEGNIKATLVPGETETGAWSVTGLSRVGGRTYVPLSFPIPLSAASAGSEKTEAHFVYLEEAAPAGCTGGTVETPTAEPGNLCIYASATKERLEEEHVTISKVIDLNPGNGEPHEVGTTGALLDLFLEQATPSEPEFAAPEGFGTWAVTEKTS